MALSENFTAIAWTGFSIFSVGWILFSLIVVGFWIAGYGTFKKGANTYKFKYKEEAAYFTGTRGSIVMVVSIVIFWMAVAFMYLSMVVDTTGKSTFILRAGESFDPFNCTFIGELSSFPVCDDALVDDGKCAILIRWMWYVPIFALFSLMFSFVFGLTNLMTIMHVIGSITLAFGLCVATYTGNENSAWTAFALAGFGYLIAISATVWSAFETNSASMFVTDVKFDGIKLEGFPKGGLYRQYMNPFAWDWVYMIFAVVVAVFYAWYLVAWAIGPAGAKIAGFGIINESATLLASDFVLFALIPVAMAAMFFFAQPGKNRIDYGHNIIATKRAIAYFKGLGKPNVDSVAFQLTKEFDDKVVEYKKKIYEPTRAISKIQSQKPSSSGKKLLKADKISLY